MKKGHIYGLVCPIENEIVYIGQTTIVLNKRLAQHITETKTKIKNKRQLSKKCKWIKNLISLKMESLIKIISMELCESKNIYLELNKKEIFWISKYSNLLNSTNGGDGNKGYKHTEECKKRMSEIKLDYFKHNEAIRGEEHVLYGTKHSEEYKKNISKKLKEYYKNNPKFSGELNPLYGIPQSEETKDKISEKNSGEGNGMYGKRFKKTPEEIEKCRIAMINSEKFQQSRKSEEYRKKISDIVSIPIYLLDEDFNILQEFKNTTKCAEYFGYTRSNVKHAVKDLRRLKRKYWVVRKENYEESIKKIKDKSLS